MQCLRKARAFRASRCNLSWNKGKELCPGCSCLIPVPAASQRDSGSHLSAPRAFCSTARRRGRYPPLSRPSDEPAARHLETKAKHRVRSHRSQRVLRIISLNHSFKANSPPGYFWMSLVTRCSFPRQSTFLLDSSGHWGFLSTELESFFLTAVAIHGWEGLDEIFLSRLCLVSI